MGHRHSETYVDLLLFILSNSAHPYGADVSGIVADYITLERVHLYAFKQLPPVSTWRLKCTGFCRNWHTIVTMPESGLPVKEQSAPGLHAKNKDSCNSHSSCTLYWYSFGFVWEDWGVCTVNSVCVNWDRDWLVDTFKSGIVIGFFGFIWEDWGVCTVKFFLCELRQRLTGCYRQRWHSDRVPLDSSEKTEVCVL